MDIKRCLSVNLQGKSVLVLVTITVIGNTVQYTVKIDGQVFHGITTKSSDLEQAIKEMLDAAYDR